MKLTHLRNATMLLELGHHRILVDPMLSPPEALPGFKMHGKPKRRNPLISLPENSEQMLAQSTAVLITHEHPDHLDTPAIEWIRQQDLPVWASTIDLTTLRKKRLRVLSVAEVAPADNLTVEVIPGQHGHGFLGWLMGPVSGFYLACKNEPTIYITSDTVLTDNVAAAIKRLQPDVIVAPAGTANFGFGKDILFSRDELIELVKLTSGQVVFNHLEAIDHCSMTRPELQLIMEQIGLADRVHLPADGETLTFQRQDFPANAVDVQPSPIRKPGLQKWLTSLMNGT